MSSKHDTLWVSKRWDIRKLEDNIVNRDNPTVEERTLWYVIYDGEDLWEADAVVSLVFKIQPPVLFDTVQPSFIHSKFGVSGKLICKVGIRKWSLKGCLI